MNLVAKEYVATKQDNPGVLILSEMAGASIELSDALIVNPTNIKEIENALLQALEMPEEEQKTIISNMQEIISSQHVGQWAKDFIDELVLVKKKKTNKWLAEQLGVNQTTVSKWCTNTTQPDLMTLKKISELLDVSVSEIINFD